MITITDVDTRKAFDIINILKTKGYSLSLHSYKSFFHRVILSVIYLKPVRKDIDKNSLVLPTEDATILKIIDKNFKFLLPPKKSLQIALDKEKFGKFCQENGFLSPKLFTLKELKSTDNFPKLILKPKSGSGSIGIKFVDTKEELDLLDIEYENYIIQERLKQTREVEGAFFLFDKGELISFYSHKRLKTYPKRGGVTIHSVSTYNKELKDIGTKLLKKLNWSGFAMIEFIKDDDGYKIIELNPRVWGSIMLSEFCGANMLKNYVEILENSSLSTSSPKEGLFIRWLFPWDIGYFVKNFFRLDRKNTCYINFSYASWYSSMLFLFYNIFNPSTFKKLIKKVLS